jgi:hypothetical protein
MNKTSDLYNSPAFLSLELEEARLIKALGLLKTGLSPEAAMMAFSVEVSLTLVKDKMKALEDSVK